MTTAYNIAILGDAGVGKTAFIRNLKCNSFEPKYNPTVGYKFHTLNATANLVDFDGQEKFGPTHSPDYLKSANPSAVILMFDVTSRNSYKNIEFWYNVVKTYNPDIPVVLVGNKVDAENRKMMASMINFHREHNLAYFDISAKTGFNVDKIVPYIVRRLDNTLCGG